MKYSIIVTLLLPLCSILYAANTGVVPMKYYDYLYNQKTMPKPDQALYQACIKWYDTERKKEIILPRRWQHAVSQKPNGAGIVGVDWGYMFFVRNINLSAVSKALDIDREVIGSEIAKDGLIHWCATMSQVIDKNENPSDEYKLCRHDLNYFCKYYLSPDEGEEYGNY